MPPERTRGDDSPGVMQRVHGAVCVRSGMRCGGSAEAPGAKAHGVEGVIRNRRDRIAKERLTVNVVLAVMARAPEPGFCKTRLAAHIGPQRAAALYEHMLLDVLDAIEQSISNPNRVLLAAPEGDGVARLRQLAGPSWQVQAQQGKGLGQRLRHALVDLPGSATAAAVLGSDAPVLPWGVIDRSLERLARGDPATEAVMGPAVDGGYYLVGMAHPNPYILQDVPWSTERVAEVTRLRCRQLGISLQELPPASDVDTPSDLARLRATLAHDSSLAPRTARLLADWP